LANVNAKHIDTSVDVNFSPNLAMAAHYQSMDRR